MRDNWEWVGGEGAALGGADIETEREGGRDVALWRLINHHH